MDVLSLYQLHKDMVFRLALSYTRSRADAEDICQAAFVKLMEHKDRIQPGKERPWLAAVTANLCKDLLKSARHRLTEPLTEDIPFESPEQSEVFAAVMALGEKERAAVYLYYYEGYSTAEVARILGCRQTAISTRLDRARKHLRSRLEADRYA